MSEQVGAGTQPASDSRYADGLRWLERSRESIVGGVKRMNLLDEPAEFPCIFTSGQGGHTRDVDGNEYIDLIADKGSVLLGHAEPAVDDAVVAAIRSGSMMPLTPTEYTLAAERLREVTGRPGDQVKFFRTGSCAVTAGVRFARAATGRRQVLTCGYHGWHDWFADRNKNPAGAPTADSVEFYYDIDWLRTLLSSGTDVAAVVVTPEPALFDGDFLPEVAKATEQAGALFLLDEVKTGFRAANHGYQSTVGVEPDLTAYSKALGNGYPVSALAGRREVMAAESRVHVSGTFETERVGLAAALACLDHYATWDRTGYERARTELVAGAERIFAAHGVGAKVCTGAGNTQLIFGDDDWAREFYRACARRGLLLYCFDDLNLMAAHADLVPEILHRLGEATREVVERSGAAPALSADHVTGYLQHHRIIGKDPEHVSRVAGRVARHLGVPR